MKCYKQNIDRDSNLERHTGALDLRTRVSELETQELRPQDPGCKTSGSTTQDIKPEGPLE